MTYRIVKQRRAWWPVEWDGVSEDGEIVRNRFEMRFHIHKVDEAFDLLAKTAEIAGRAAAADAEGDRPKASALYADAARLLATDFRGVEAENGEAMAWSVENLALLMGEPGCYPAVQRAYGEVAAGGQKARAGN